MNGIRPNHLRDVRLALFLDQREVARRAGVSATSYGMIERQEIEAKPATMRKIAGALRIDPPWRVYVWDEHPDGRRDELLNLLHALTATDRHGANARWAAMLDGLDQEEHALLLSIPVDATPQTAVDTIVPWVRNRDRDRALPETRKLALCWAGATAESFPRAIPEVYIALGRHFRGRVQ